MDTLAFTPPPAPVAGLTATALGIGLRAAHHADVSARLATEAPLPVDFLEVHAENYLHPGSPPQTLLLELAERVPISVHSIGLSLGSADGVDCIHLDRLAALVAECGPAFVSDHLAWSRVGGRYLNDLLPLPYTSEALDVVCANIDRVQTRLKRPLLLENPSTYLAVPGDWPEGAFMAEILRRTGCGLLLDVNNIYVSACNQGRTPLDWLTDYPLAATVEIHVAGHDLRETARGPVRIDTHAAPVCSDVWALYHAIITEIGPRPTLLEWDETIPSLDELFAEAEKARSLGGLR